MPKMLFPIIMQKTKILHTTFKHNNFENFYHLYLMGTGIYFSQGKASQEFFFKNMFISLFS